MQGSATDRTLPEPFVRVLLANQGTVYAYVTSLLGGDAQQAEEVLQETNVVLCRQADQFESITDFTAWACRIAYFEVLSYRKRCRRDRHRFDDELLTVLADEGMGHIRELGPRQRALTECLGRLSELQRDMIVRRYGSDGSVQSVAEEYGRSPGAISQSLHRIRGALLKCIRHKVALAEQGGG
jgi:RNA polymerase sigma-70 factor (ECF subfamily)